MVQGKSPGPLWEHERGAVPRMSSNGSRWYTPVWEGLFAAEHCERMGPALWLYGWIISRAHVAQKDGAITYNHDTAAQELGRSRATIRAWFSTLQQHGYVQTRARHPYHLEVQVTKWRTVEEWLAARKNAQGDGYILSTLGKESAIESAKESAGNVSLYSIFYNTMTLEDPSGSGEPETLTGGFARLLEQLRGAKNKAAVLRGIYVLCFGPADAPDYGYLGRAAKAVGGAGRLAQMMWELTAQPPTGDVLAFCMARARRARSSTIRGDEQGDTPRGAAAIDAWLASREGASGN